MHFPQLHPVLVHLLLDLLVLGPHLADREAFVLVELVLDDVDRGVEVVGCLLHTLAHFVQVLSGPSHFFVKFVYSVLHSCSLSTGSFSGSVRLHFFFLT